MLTTLPVTTCPTGKMVGSNVLTNRLATVVAWTVLIAAFIHPADGLGLNICWIKSTTGMPCPGCGLSRSLSCAIRGDLYDSFCYHPFGVALLIFFLSVAGASLAPARMKNRIDYVANLGNPRTRLIYATLTGAFVLFGTARALLHWTP